MLEKGIEPLTPISKMTDEQLRLAIAEELGFCIHFGGTEIYYRDKQEAKENIWRCRECEAKVVKQCDLPNYPSDNNAAMRLEEEICKNPTDRLRYIQALQGVLGWVYNDAIDLYDLIHATARQRSEAWLIVRRNDG